MLLRPDKSVRKKYPELFLPPPDKDPRASTNSLQTIHSISPTLSAVSTKVDDEEQLSVGDGSMLDRLSLNKSNSNTHLKEETVDVEDFSEKRKESNSTE